MLADGKQTTVQKIKLDKTQHTVPARTVCMISKRCVMVSMLNVQFGTTYNLQFNTIETGINSSTSINFVRSRTELKINLRIAPVIRLRGSRGRTDLLIT